MEKSDENNLECVKTCGKCEELEAKTALLKSMIPIRKYCIIAEVLELRAENAKLKEQVSKLLKF
jgi:hypothetical protein